MQRQTIAIFHQLSRCLLYLAATVAGAAIGLREGPSAYHRLMFIGAGFAILFYFFDALPVFLASGWIGRCRLRLR